MLCISNLSVSVDHKPVLDKLSLSIEAGSVHALMGPNGSGKSSLASVLMGHPAYAVTEGTIYWHDANITNLAPHERAQLGLFLAVQYPPAIPGVRIKQFLFQACRAVLQDKFCLKQFDVEFQEACTLLALKPELCERGMHDGFSGGEKKRLELLQMLMLKPSLVILDEIDSGLDIDAVRLVGAVIDHLRATNPQTAFLVITHYQRILAYIKPDYVHVLAKGRLAETGTYALVQSLEARGYDAYQ